MVAITGVEPVRNPHQEFMLPITSYGQNILANPDMHTKHIVAPRVCISYSAIRLKQDTSHSRRRNRILPAMKDRLVASLQTSLLRCTTFSEPRLVNFALLFPCYETVQGVR